MATMASCCVCNLYVKKSINIFEYTTGKPPAVISDLINECIEGTNCKLKSNGICKKCLNIINRYYRAKQIVEQVKNEVLELFWCVNVEKENELIEEIVYNDLKSECQESVFTSDSNFILEDNKEFNNYDTLNNCIEDVEGVVEHIEEEHIENNDETVTEVAIESIGIEIDECFIDNSSIESETLEIHDTSNDEDSQYDEFLLIQKDEYLSDDQPKSKKRITYCSKCNMQFKDSKEYRLHHKKVHFAGYICDECGKTLYSYSGFLNHKESHNPVKKFECTECGERYHLKIQLKYHMAWHSGEKPFQCEICSKQFVHRVALYKHKKLHESNERRYECEICGSKFRTSAHLRRHSMTHTGAKPHSCPICGKCFAQAYNMRVHLKEHQKPGSSRKQRYQCTQCASTFMSKKDYNIHLNHCSGNELIEEHNLIL